MITYKMSIKVFLEKKHIGDIKEVENGFQYYPKGQKSGGEVFKTVNEVKRSLECE